MLILIAILVGLSVLIISGSRSPFLAAVLSLLLYFYLSFRQRPRFSRVVMLILILLFGYLLAEFLSRYFSLKFFSRLEAVFSIGSGSGSGGESLSITSRMTSFRGGIEQFYSAPILGDSIIEKNTNFYPHNIMIESLMSTGLIGTFFLCVTMIYAFSCAVTICRNNTPHLWTVLLFVQLLIFHQFSGALWSAAALFGVMSAIVSIGNSVKMQLR